MENRSVAIVVALLALCGLFVLGGADLPLNPHDDLGPDEQALDADFNQYAGERIATGGVVVDADTNQVHIEPEETDLVVILDIDPSHDVTLEDGHEVTFSGTISEDHTIVVGPDDHIWVTAPWEVTYMFAISFLGALLTGLLIVNYWRLDLQRFAVEPREEPLFTILQEGKTDD